MIISAGNSQKFSASKYLNIFTANRSFTISSKDEGLTKTTVKAGYSYDLEQYTTIDIHNEGVDDLTLDFEMSTLRVVTGSSSGVDVNNEPWIMGMRNPITVNSTATVENGKMANNVSNNFAPIAPANITVADGATLEIFPAKVALNRKIALQLVTASVNSGKIRVGDSAANTTPTKGFFVSGNEDGAGGYEWETETAVFVHNYSGEPITLAGGETWRA